MAEVKTVIYGDVTIRKIFGVLTFDEIMKILKKSYTRNPTKHSVWDLLEASLKQLKFEDFERLGDFVMQYASLRAGGKTAIVASNDLEYGFGRIIDSLAESKNAPIATRTFRNLSEAAKWIGVDDLTIKE